MNSYGFWEKFGVLLTVNFVVVSIIVMLMFRGAWSFSGAAILILIAADALVVSRIQRASATSGRAHAGGGRFFSFYAYALGFGGLVWIVLRIKEGIRWVDLAPFLILVLLAVAMLSIARKMRRG